MKTCLLRPATLQIFFAAFLLCTAGAAENKLISFDSAEYTFEEKVAKLTGEWAVNADGVIFRYEPTMLSTPADNYDGPPFSAAFFATISGEGEMASNGQTAIVSKRGGKSVISLLIGIGRNDTTAKTVTAAGFLLFPSKEPFAIKNDEMFSAEVTNSFSGAKPQGRWLIRTADGKLFVSAETFKIGHPTFSTALTSTEWHEVEASDTTIALSEESSPVVLEGITAAGVFFGGDRAKITSAANSHAVGFRLVKFSAGE